MASDAQALTAVPTIEDFASQNPIPAKLTSIEGINVLFAALALKHVVEVKLIPNASDDGIDDASLGRCSRLLIILKKQKGIVFAPYHETNLENGFNISFKVVLDLSSKPLFDETQIVSGVADDSHAAIVCAALAQVYVDKPYDLNTLLIVSFHEFQKFGLPAFISADAVRISISGIVSEHPIFDVFARQNVVSPFRPAQSPFLTAPSPVPFETTVKMDNVPMIEEAKIQSKPEWQIQGRRRHIVGASAEPPASVLADSYNGKRPEGGSAWIMRFSDFWKNGESGDRTNGRVVQPNERFRLFTRKVRTSHETLKGKDPNDPAFLDYMKNELGVHYADWSKYNWSEIDLNLPFPENPPMKSS